MMYLEKKDPEALYLNVKVRGGEVPGATFSQLLGKHKLNAKLVGEDVRKATVNFTGNKVGVTLEIKDRKVVVYVTPSTAQLLINALGEKRAARKKGVERELVVHNGDLKFQQVVATAQTVLSTRSRSKNMKRALLEVLGTADTIGLTIDGLKPKELTGAVKEGRDSVASLLGKSEDADTLPAFLDEE